VPPPSARAINPQLTAAHEAILMRSLAKSRDDRFSSMADFRMAMLDPTRYLASAPPPPRVTSAVTSVEKPGSLVTKSEDILSGQVVFGAGTPEAAPERPGPQPSTFRHGVGQLVEEEPPVVLRKSRKGLVLAALGAAVVAGAGGFYFYSAGQSDPANQQVLPPKTDPTPSPPVTPPTPVKTVIKFGSDPAGAEVVRKDTGDVLGTTPFEASVPSAKNPVQFTFRKANFRDKTLEVVPEGPVASLAASLVELPPPPVEQPIVKAPASKTRRPPPPKVKVKAPRPVNDEDAVLEPSFK
jgi:hypothetical protein